MSYDPQTTQTLIQASAAHKRMPNAEFVELLVKQLKEAEAHMGVLSTESRNARTDLSEARRSLLQEEMLHRETRAELDKLRAARTPNDEDVKAPPPNPISIPPPVGNLASKLTVAPAAAESGQI